MGQRLTEFCLLYFNFEFRQKINEWKLLFGLCNLGHKPTILILPMIQWFYLQATFAFFYSHSNSILYNIHNLNNQILSIWALRSLDAISIHEPCMKEKNMIFVGYTVLVISSRAKSFYNQNNFFFVNPGREESNLDFEFVANVGK